MRTTIGSGGFGFPLIELLVVIAIIGILAGMLLPTLNRTREKTRRAGCASNLRQIGIAMVAYADDNQNHYPTAGDWPGDDRTWDYKLTAKGYLNANVLTCPSDMVARNPAGCSTSGTVPLTGFRSYAIACGRGLDPQSHFIQGSRLKCTYLGDASSTVLVAERVDSTFNAYVGAKCSEWFNAPGDIAPPVGVHLSRNTLACNYLFCDGHVAWSENPPSNWFPSLPAGAPAANPCP